jgi:flagellar hook protein FlgE|tara:strand:- start:503 stop:772 length:270 start_codon:yes stop_codon:yes gene_type:complete
MYRASGNRVRHRSARRHCCTGAGFFSVNTDNNSTGDSLYTRAGSFRQDNLGNLRNTGGFFLQGWPLDANGRLPGGRPANQGLPFPAGRP